MTDRDLAVATLDANRIERQARATLTAGDAADRAAAQATVRQAVALRRALESWIVSRAMAAQGGG